MTKNQIYKKVLGVNHKDYINAINNVQKMAWEQVLLLAIYSRQICFGNTESMYKGTYARIKLIQSAKGLLDKGEGKNALVNNVLTWLDNGDGSNSIIRKLDELNKQSGKYSNEQVLLRSIEEKNIAFQPRQITPAYSYFAIYKILVQPIEVFRELLKFPRIVEYFDDWLADRLNNYLSSKHFYSFERSPFSEEATKQSKNIETLLSYINEKKLVIDKESFNLYLKTNVAELLGATIQNSFKPLIFKQSKKWHDEMNRNIFSELFIQEPDDAKYKTIKVDKHLFEHLKSLGQIDSVMQGLRHHLLSDGKSSQTISWLDLQIDENHAAAFDDISQWYENKKTPLINKPDQIPKLIASVIEFDIRYGVADFKKLTNLKKTSKDIYKLTTSVIRECLYYDSGVALLFRDLVHIPPMEQLITYFEQRCSDERKEESYCAAAMEKWANKEEKAMTERFKKLPPYLKSKRYVSISGFVKEQMKIDQKQSVSYPLNSPFPLPLWFYNRNTHPQIETPDKQEAQ